MADRRFWTLTAGTAGCALAIGFVMQTFLADPRPEPNPSDRAALVQPQALLSVDNLETPAPPKTRSVENAPQIVTRNQSDPLLVPVEPPVSIPPTSSQDFAQNDETCPLKVSAEPAARASVALTVDVPCYPDARITIHHSGLSFTLFSDITGHASITVPALSDRAVFVLTVAGGGSNVVSLSVPELADWHRVALQWTGPAAFEIHAREFGARYGTPGHVWDGTPENAQTGSFLTRLGDATGPEARMVEIYSIPRTAAPRNGMVTLTVETEVTVQNCDRDIAAQILQRPAGSPPRSRDLTLSMPGCSAIGDFLVLNNLLEDLKIAAN